MGIDFFGFREKERKTGRGGGVTTMVSRGKNNNN